MDRLAAILRRQRHSLELLLFRLVEARHLLAAGEGRFLAWAADDVQDAATKVREIELERALAVSRIAVARGVATDDLTLRELADSSPEPYRTIFVELRGAFLELTQEIDAVIAANRDLAAQGVKGVDEVLGILSRADDALDGLDWAGMVAAELDGTLP